MFTQHHARQRGFTLIELVVVIVIIGILAAFAIPRFAGLAKDARIASVRGMLGTTRSSSALVHGLALARSSTLTSGDGNVELEGVAAPGVAVIDYYPAGSATGIVAAIGNTENYTIDTSTAGTVIFQVNGASTMATCSVTYTQSSPTNPIPNVPDITSNEAGC